MTWAACRESRAPRGRRRCGTARRRGPRPAVRAATRPRKLSAALSSAFTHSGRPERNTATTGTSAPRSRLSSARSCLSPGGVLERRHVTGVFRVRAFAEHDDGHVGTGMEFAGGAQLGAAAGRAHHARDTCEDRLGMREVLVGLGALPVDGPAARLPGDAVGAVAGHQHVLRAVTAAADGRGSSAAPATRAPPGAPAPGAAGRRAARSARRSGAPTAAPPCRDARAA